MLREHSYVLMGQKPLRIADRKSRHGVTCARFPEWFNFWKILEVICRTVFVDASLPELFTLRAAQEQQFLQRRKQRLYDRSSACHEASIQSFNGIIGLEQESHLFAVLRQALPSEMFQACRKSIENEFGCGIESCIC